MNASAWRHGGGTFSRTQFAARVDDGTRPSFGGLLARSELPDPITNRPKSAYCRASRLSSESQLLEPQSFSVALPPIVDGEIRSGIQRRQHGGAGSQLAFRQP